ncbi:hypothetical protein Tco_1328774 [Tanacetum coccineum]
MMFLSHPIVIGYSLMVFCLPPMRLRCFGSLPMCNVVSASNPEGFTIEGSQRIEHVKSLKDRGSSLCNDTTLQFIIVVGAVALDNALVAPEKRLKIKKCNSRIEFTKRQIEPTLQVTLDVLKLSPCYLAFQMTAEVPESVLEHHQKDSPTLTDLMHQPGEPFGMLPHHLVHLWEVNGDLTNFGCFKSSNLMGNIHKLDVDFVAPTIYRRSLHVSKLTTEILVPITKSICLTPDSPSVSSIYGALILVEIIDQDIQTSDEYQMYLSFATVALTEEEQLKEVLLRSKKDTHISHPSGSGDGTNFKSRVPDELKARRLVKMKELVLNQGGDEEENDDDDNDDDSENVGDNDEDDEQTKFDERGRY